MTWAHPSNSPPAQKYNLRMTRRHARRQTLFQLESLEHRRLLSGAGIFSTSQDIGSPTPPGSLSHSNGTYTMTAGGADIGGTSDQFHFAYNTSAADGSVIARVTSLANTNSAAKAGLMFRNGTSASAAFAGIFVTPSSGIQFITRATDGGTAGSSSLFGPGIPRYLRLTRVGAQITAFQSPDGNSWSQLGSTTTITLTNALAGVAATSRNTTTATTATFTNVSMLPAGWSGGDVGAPAISGSAAFDPASNSFAQSGGGSGIGGTADQFNFVSRSITGGGEVVARIDSLSSSEASARGGVMIRGDLTAGAAFAGISVTNQNSLIFQWRSSAGAAASSTTVAGFSTPVWLKLAQQGNSFSAFRSTDNLTWTQIGATQSIAMPSATAFGGTVLTSSNAAAIAEATFSRVSFLQNAWSGGNIGAAALPASAVFDAPSNTYTLTGGGAGISGSSDEFTFARRSMSGDGSAIAYINSLTAANPAALAGVMLRDGDAAGAAFAGVFISAQSEVSFRYRASAGAPLQQQTIPAVAAPLSLRVTRVGNAFSAAYSTDGITWIAVGSPQNISTPAALQVGAAVSSGSSAAMASASFTGIGVGTKLPPGAGIYSAADELFLHDLSQRSVRFFYDETNPATGLVPDGALANGGSNSSPSSIASVGFGLSALTIGDQRGWLSHNDAYQRALTTVNFLYNSGAHHNGFFYHFLSTTTGARAWNSELSSIDSALLMAGVLNVAQHWDGTPLETAAMNLFNRVNWPFMQKPNGQFYGAWSPENGFDVFTYADFSEGALLYLLGMGSSTFATAPSSWLSWSRTPVINYAGYNFVTAQTKALFTTQYPQGWFDMRGLVDATGLNYYANSQTAALAQRQMFINMAGTYPHFGPNMWGATAADGPNGYTVFGGPPAANIDGTIVPTAPGGSLAFLPRQTIDALKNMQQTYGATVYRKYGFVDAFNPAINWTSQIVLGIDVGMMLLAAENSRSNFVWNTFAQSPVAQQALAAAFPSVTPTLAGVVSRRPNAAIPDLPVNLSGDISIENRANGPAQLVLNFGSNVVKGPNFSVALSSGAVTLSTTSGSSLIIDVAGVADAQVLSVNVTDVRNFASSAGGNYSFELGVLLADANQDGAVNSDDFNSLATNFGQSNRNSSQGNFNDDSVVNSDDFNLLAGQFGKTMSQTTAIGAARFSGVPIRAAWRMPPAAKRADDERRMVALVDSSVTR